MQDIMKYLTPLSCVCFLSKKYTWRLFLQWPTYWLVVKEFGFFALMFSVCFRG